MTRCRAKLHVVRSFDTNSCARRIRAVVASESTPKAATVSRRLCASWTGTYETASAEKSSDRPPMSVATTALPCLIRFLQNAGDFHPGAKEIALQFNSAIDPDTLRAYEETHYRVLGDAPTTLRIGHANPDLAKLHLAFSVDCSAFVTAANPFSTLTRATANAVRQAALVEQLGRMGLHFIEGIGKHPSGTWQGESSLLVLGITLSDAKQLGMQHEQNAIVWCDSDTVPQLILLR
jgi:Protein of unknown function (DUF3293)